MKSLRRRPITDRIRLVTLRTCAVALLVSGFVKLGVDCYFIYAARLRDLAAIARASPAAQYVDFQSFDKDYHESWDIESATHPQTLIAYGLDGHMLGAAHGAPARVHSPVKLGYKNTKYLTRIAFMPTRNGGYWSDQGYEWYGGV